VNLSTIRDDLKTRLATISGLQTYDTVPAKPEVPCAIVEPASGTPHASFERGSGDVRFDVTMLVQCADWPSAQDALDGFLSTGTGSVIDALETAPGGGEDVTVESWDGYGTAPLGENLYGSVVLHVVVPTSS
jgi:hypothetical protein